MVVVQENGTVRINTNRILQFGFELVKWRVKEALLLIRAE
jgi:hypothetical protein